MSFSAMDIEAAFAVILAALEEGEDLAPFLQQFPPGSRRSLMLMLQASLPATRTAGKLQAVPPKSAPGPAGGEASSSTPPALAQPVPAQMAGASTAGGGSGCKDGGVPAPAGPSMPEPNPEPPANVAAQAQPAPWPVPPPRKQPPTLPADGAPQATHLGQAKAKPPPVELWQSEGFRSEADARRSSAMGFVTAEAYYQSMAAPPVPPRAQPKQYKPSFPPVKPASQAPASSSADMAALQARIASEIAAGGSVLVAGPAPVPPGYIRAEVRGQAFTVNRDTGDGFPMLPRQATEQERRANDAEFRRLVELRFLLCSVEWQRHMQAMNMAGATTDIPLPAPMQASGAARRRGLHSRRADSPRRRGLHHQVPGASPSRRPHPGAP